MQKDTNTDIRFDNFSGLPGIFFGSINFALEIMQLTKQNTFAIFSRSHKHIVKRIARIASGKESYSDRVSA